MKDAFLKNPESLELLLGQSEASDIDILVDYITDKGEGRITLSSDTCKRLVTCKAQGAYSAADRAVIAEEIRRFGGNTVANLFRDARNAIPWGSMLDTILPDAASAVPYSETVRDVASHLKVPFQKDSDVLVIEDGLLRKILRDSFDKMSADEKKKVLEELNVTDLSLLKPAASAALIAAGRYGGFATYKVALIIANSVAKTILGRGLPLAANAMIGKTLSLLMGPVGWVVTGLWTVADMASPAYRVTVPCVIQLAYMRQKAIAAAFTTTCEKCSSANEISAKFCAECGSPMAGEKA